MYDPEQELEDQVDAEDDISETEMEDFLAAPTSALFGKEEMSGIISKFQNKFGVNPLDLGGGSNMSMDKLKFNQKDKNPMLIK